MYVTDHKTELHNLLRQRWLMSADAVLLHARYVNYLLAKANFNPNQPRVPRGSPNGGEWTRVEGAATTRPAGRPTNDFPILPANFDPPDPPDDWPEIPDKRPRRSRERTRVLIEVGGWIWRNASRRTLLGQATTVGHWLYDLLPIVDSYLDKPRSLSDLIERAREPSAGYDRHHIVEQSAAKQNRFPRDRINAQENIVLIPRIRHWMINRWYSVPNRDYGGISPREYLRGKSWEEHFRVGLNALRMFEVLEP